VNSNLFKFKLGKATAGLIFHFTGCEFKKQSERSPKKLMNP